MGGPNRRLPPSLTDPPTKVIYKGGGLLLGGDYVHTQVYYNCYITIVISYYLYYDI